jgi:uncharacterized membrane protein YfcA
MTTESERRSARFVVWFVVASMVPAFLGFVVGVSAKRPIVVIAVGVVVLSIDIAMMRVVRKRRRAREKGEPKGDGQVGVPARVVILALIGVVASGVTAALQLAEAGGDWARFVVGTLGAGVLLLAGWLAISHNDKA